MKLVPFNLTADDLYNELCRFEIVEKRASKSQFLGKIRRFRPMLGIYDTWIDLGYIGLCKLGDDKHYKDLGYMLEKPVENNCTKGYLYFSVPHDEIDAYYDFNDLIGLYYINAASQ